MENNKQRYIEVNGERVSPEYSGEGFGPGLNSHQTEDGLWGKRHEYVFVILPGFLVKITRKGGSYDGATKTVGRGWINSNYLCEALSIKYYSEKRSSR